MHANGIEWLNSTTKSIEEIAATIIAETSPRKNAQRVSLCACRGHSKAPAASSPFRFLINLLALYSLFPIESSENIALNIFQERHHEKPVL